MTAAEYARPIEILLVEDNPADIKLTREALKEARVRNTLHVAESGDEAMKFLRREGPHAGAPRPDLILLDLNLPVKNGLEVLSDIKANRRLKTIPIVILTCSEAEQDVARAYSLQANCYVTKPLDLDGFIKVIGSIENFWLSIVQLPTE